MEQPRTPLLQSVDDATRALARRLVRATRHGALAVLEPASGWPLASRTAVATDVDGVPVILVSSLSAHTAALAADGRCSLLLGEPGRGDPLAHPRITVIGRGRRVDRANAALHARVRRRYLARHPKAALYVDFGDFAFWRIEPERASLNGGFGRAFELQATDLLSPPGDPAAFGALEAEAAAHMNADHPEAVALLATALGRTPAGAWALATLDPHGFELVDGDAVCRLEFDAPVQDAESLHRSLVAMTRAARDVKTGSEEVR
jgi:putative heme iron utilization protein